MHFGEKSRIFHHFGGLQPMHFGQKWRIFHDFGGL